MRSRSKYARKQQRAAIARVRARHQWERSGGQTPAPPLPTSRDLKLYTETRR